MKCFENYSALSSLVCAAILLISTIPASYALPSESAEARALIDEHIQPYLIESGHCKNRKDCFEKDLVLFNDGYKSLRIDIYQSTSKLIEVMAPRVISQRAKLRKTIVYEINFYQMAHRDAGPFAFMSAKPICTVTFTGEQ